MSDVFGPTPAWRGDLRRSGMLLVLRRDHAAGPLHEEPEAASPEPEGHGLELFLSIDDGGRVTAYNGHVDLGTGIGTALAQIVAEELDVAFDAVTVVLGHSGSTPNQGATIASETIQVTAIPLRRAAAQARHSLVALAAEAMGVPADDLSVEDGTVRRVGGNAARSYGDLLRGRRIHLRLDDAAPLKAATDYRLLGQRVPRVDIPDKVTGAFTYVHDVRVPGMLHGRVVRPPYAGFDHGPFVGRSLLSVDEGSVAHVPGLVAVVVVGDFIGVVAEREEQAALAAETLVTRWRGWDPAPDLGAPETAIRANPSTPRVLLDKGDVEAALAGAATPMRRTYSWPYHLHGSIGPSCSVADVRPDGITLWSGTQNPLMLRTDIAKLTGTPEARISVVRHEAAGCYGRPKPGLSARPVLAGCSHRSISRNLHHSIGTAATAVVQWPVRDQHQRSLSTGEDMGVLPASWCRWNACMPLYIHYDAQKVVLMLGGTLVRTVSPDNGRVGGIPCLFCDLVN